MWSATRPSLPASVPQRCLVPSVHVCTAGSGSIKSPAATPAEGVHTVCTGVGKSRKFKMMRLSFLRGMNKRKGKQKDFSALKTLQNLAAAPLIWRSGALCREGEAQLWSRARGLSPGGAISKWEPPTMTSPLSVNHLCLISPPGALQSKYQCGRPTKTVGCIRRITQAAHVLHHRGWRRFNYPRRGEGTEAAEDQAKVTLRGKSGRTAAASRVEPWKRPSEDVAKPDESGVTLRCGQGRAASAVREKAQQQLHRSDSQPIDMFLPRITALW